MIKPEVLDAMLLAGCSAEQIVAAVKADRGSNSAGAKRQAKYRAAKKEREEAANAVVSDDSDDSDVTSRNGDACDVTEHNERDAVTDGFSLSPVPLLSPTPPNNPLTPNPSSQNKTSARETGEKTGEAWSSLAC